MSRNKTSKEFRVVLEAEAPTYEINLTAKDLDRLTRYYELLNKWNAHLHLVAPSPPKVFATRHVLESLLLLKHLPEGARIADIGAGGGLPTLPCLITRPDVHGFLIEASKKKAIFLREALGETATAGQAIVIAERFENIDPPEVDFITSRALERFEQMLQDLLSWAPATSQLLLFGGDALGSKLTELGLPFSKKLIPQSQRRYLFALSKTLIK